MSVPKFIILLLLQEIKKLKAEICDEKEEKSRLVAMVRSAEETRDEKCQERNKVKQRVAKEMYAVTLGEANNFLAFLNFLSEEFLPDSDVLSELIAEQKIFVERIKKDPIYKR